MRKHAGDRVIGGTVNGTGSFVMRAERVGSETLLAQIVQMVAEAQRSRAPIQRLADVVSSYFVPAVVVIAVVTFIVWSIWGPEPRMAYGLVNAVAVLIIACPVRLDWRRRCRSWWQRERRAERRAVQKCRSDRSDAQGRYARC